MSVPGPPPTAEFPIPSADGLPLHARLWTTSGARALLVIAHGLGEHGGCYAHVAATLAEGPDPVDCLAFDFRGSGASPGRRGVVRRYEDLVGDLRAVLAWAAARWPERPRFVLGHSNGAQVALRLVLDEVDGGRVVAAPGVEPSAATPSPRAWHTGPGGASRSRTDPHSNPSFDGLVLSSPSLRLALRIPPHKLWIGRMLRRVAPGLTLRGDLADEELTRDPGVWRHRSADRLRHQRISPPLFFGMVEGGGRVLAQAGSIRLPVLVLLGAADPVIDVGAASAFFERLGSPDKTLRLYAGRVHEPLNDLGRDEVLADLRAWLRRRPG